MKSIVIIERPVEEVFGFVVDLSNISSTDPSVQSVEKTSEGPIDAGTTFRMRQKAPPLGRVREASVRYTAVEPNRKIEFEAMVGPISPTASLTFEQVANGGTRVTFRGKPNPVGPFKLLSPLIGRQGQRKWDKRLAHLKSTLEFSEEHQPQEEEENQQREGVRSGKAALSGGFLVLVALTLVIYVYRLYRQRSGARRKRRRR
jgi:carbon monoxide dehydrogenase subunit G